MGGHEMMFSPPLGRKNFINGNSLLAFCHEAGIPHAKTDFTGEANLTTDSRVLVTHNGGFNILDGYRDTVAVTSLGIAGFISLPQSLRWMCLNSETTRPLNEGLPLGIDNWEIPECAKGDYAKHYTIGSLEHENQGLELVGAIEEAQQSCKRQTGNVLMCWRRDTAPYDRGRAELILKGAPWTTWHDADIDSEARLSPVEFIRELSRHRFVVCPTGNGIDCHRIWEALYLGVVPIVRRCRALEWFKDMPIMFVDDWTEVTPPNLAAFARVARHERSTDRLFIAWWENHIRRAHEGRF